MIKVQRGWKLKEAESRGGQTSTDSQCIVDATGLPGFLYKMLLFSLKQFMCSVVKLRCAHCLCLIWGPGLNLQRPGLIVLSLGKALGVLQVGPVPGPSADLWPLVTSSASHYFPLASPLPLPNSGMRMHGWYRCPLAYWYPVLFQSIFW